MKQTVHGIENSAIEPLDIQRRQLLIGAGIAGLVAAGTGRASAQMGAKSAGAAPSGRAPMEEMVPASYDPAYVEHVIMPFLRTSFYQAEGPSLPMIGEALSKEHAIPYDLWGLLYDDWAPSFEKDGLSVFILGLDKPGPDNRRKRVYDGKPLPVCDHAGYAPFGFGYRRCPGEQLNIEVFGDFLRKVWAEKIEFEQLNTPNPAKIPIGPVTVIDDAIGFRRRA
jgi:hypothetical protein